MSQSFPEHEVRRPSLSSRFGTLWVNASGLRLFGAAMAVVAFGSLPVFTRTFLTDMDFYTHVADKLLAGGVLYKDALDTKPPAIFFHYALVFRWLGENNLAAVKAITVLFLTLSAAVAGGVWRNLFGRRYAALATLV